MKWVLAGTAFLLLAPALLLAPIAAVPDTAIAYAGASEDKLISLVLSNPAIRFESSPRRDVESGLIDSRLLVTLFSIARTHDITINVLVSGHSYFVKDTNRVSNHIFGRGVDIPVVDGLKVSSSNAAALVLVQEVTSLPISIRPEEIGSPWRMPGVFTDAGHKDHIHLGWEAK